MVCVVVSETATATATAIVTGTATAWLQPPCFVSFFFRIGRICSHDPLSGRCPGRCAHGGTLGNRFGVSTSTSTPTATSAWARAVIYARPDAGHQGVKERLLEWLLISPRVLASLSWGTFQVKQVLSESLCEFLLESTFIPSTMVSFLG